MNTATKYFLWVVAAEEESFLILILIISSVSSTQFRDLHIIADLVEFIQLNRFGFLSRLWHQLQFGFSSLSAFVRFHSKAEQKS